MASDGMHGLPTHTVWLSLLLLFIFDIIHTAKYNLLAIVFFLFSSSLWLVVVSTENEIYFL